MQFNPFFLALLFVGQVVIAHSTCLTGCTCREETTPISRTLVIQDCDNPLILTKEVLQSVSKDIKTIAFYNVIIKKIENDGFARFDALETVIIQDSTIETIEPSAFDLPELDKMNFARSTFIELPTLHAQYIEELIFDDCKLSQVPNLDNLVGLKFVNLANNFITTIDESTFAKSKLLEEVNLSNNSISHLPQNLFIHSKDFNTLNVDHNPLTKFEISSEIVLELLSLRHCKLTTFDRGLAQNLSECSSLDLSGNEIEVLPIDAFEPMKELNNLDLSNNKLVELDDDIFLENNQLDKIILDNNPFEKLPNFQSKKYFQTQIFSCKNCDLTSMDGVFDNMPMLKQLFLSNNQISSINKNSFDKLNYLVTLDVSGNPLKPIDPVVLALLPSLKKLNVSDASLDKLWANHNAELPSLEELYIEKNNLTVIKTEDLKILPKLKILNLEDNSFSCERDTDLYDVYDHLIDNKIFPATTRTHANLDTDDDVHAPSLKNSWSSVLPADCLFNDYDEDYSDDGDDDDDEDYKPTEELNKNYIDIDENSEDDDEGDVEASILNPGGFSLAKASYILSITSVFILTALLVLFIAVILTLLILKRNKAFNMHNGNLPRLKIPLWHTTPGQKKHSGSVYRPLSEELSGPRTPIINRYEFKQTPQVHNSLP